MCVGAIGVEARVRHVRARDWRARALGDAARMSSRRVGAARCTGSGDADPLAGACGTSRSDLRARPAEVDDVRVMSALVHASGPLHRRGRGAACGRLSPCSRPGGGGGGGSRRAWPPWRGWRLRSGVEWPAAGRDRRRSDPTSVVAMTVPAEPATAPDDGARDIARAVDRLARRMPEPLQPLARIAYNYRWSWTPGGRELFRALGAHRFGLTGENPVRFLRDLTERTLLEAATDDEYLDRVDTVDQRATRRPGPTPVRAVRRSAAWRSCARSSACIASLPVYSGGLGVLAGDLLKEASDQALPVVGVGLLYRRGYFHQRVDRSGWQHEYWIEADPEALPAVRVTNSDGAPLTTTVPVWDQSSSPTCGGSTWAGCRCTCSMPSSPRTHRSSAGSARASTRATAPFGSRSTHCWAWARCAPSTPWGSIPRSTI